MSIDWIVGWWSESTNLQAAFEQTQLTLITLNELEDKGDSLRVERVIGQYYLENIDSVNGVLCHVRLVVRPSHPALGAWEMPITDAEGAEEKLMWHKVHYLGGRGTNVGGPSAHPEWSHIDVKVNRSLNDNEELLLIIECGPPFHDPEEQGQVRYAAWIRVLVKS